MKRKILSSFALILFLFTSAQTDRSQAIRIGIVGDEYLKEGLFVNAIYYYQEALKVYPEYVKATFQIAQCYRLSNRQDSAVHYYESIVSQGQDFRYPMSRYHLAMMQLEQNKTQEAKANLITFRELLEENSLSTLKKYVDFYDRAQEELDKM